MFLILTLGAVSMLAPFVLMLSGATRTGVDKHEFSMIPRFLWEDNALYRKHVEALHNESAATLRAAWRTDLPDFSGIELLPSVDTEEVARWEAHLADWPIAVLPGYAATPESRSRPLNVRGFARYLKSEISRDIERVNEVLETDFADWNAFLVIPPDTRSRLNLTTDTPWWQAWGHYVHEVAPEWTLGTHDLTGFFHERVWVPRHGRGVPPPLLSATIPEAEREAEAWLLFVREVVHPDFLRISDSALGDWQRFLQARYVNLQTLWRATGTEVDAWEDLALPARWREADPFQADWEAFLQGWKDPDEVLHRAAAEHLTLDSADLSWQREHGTPPPIREAGQLKFERHLPEIRRAFLTQHFSAVWEILIVDGRGLGNTVFYCAMAVLLALIVNPLAAYALSRFRPPNAYALLLFLLLTMAFPPMVTQIPVFLMLRDFGLLNTFWALLLPGMAHGYSIFLLKGFFDSLPRDLYESAALDGAGEIRMFWMITFSLSKPILAVIALSAFVSAYTNFMFALLICQDESMWTLMVWLYQLQQSYGPGVMNAAFVIAALPTLLVFLLAQNQIMRGIVIPVEK
ncbi:MAG: carbohydrate ABC transporter permease [Verrucomicrobia bacterium]|nr:carbohydrate ABC transporter permease [Verrucomicrobiota bacterium]